jgi:hypothetical protein
MITEGTLPNLVGEEARDIMQTRMQAMISINPNLLVAQERMKKYADNNKTERHLEVGDMTYIKLQPYRHTALGIHNSLKLHSKFYGSFKVLQKIDLSCI